MNTKERAEVLDPVPLSVGVRLVHTRFARMHARRTPTTAKIPSASGPLRPSCRGTGCSAFRHGGFFLLSNCVFMEPYHMQLSGPPF